MSYNQQIINLSKENFENDIYIQDFSKTDEIENTLIYPVFEQTFKRIRSIVEKKCEIRESGIYQKKRHRCNNIIPFLGGRGTGKTSTMSSIVNFLDNQDLQKYRNSHLEFNKMGINPEFICIDRIDADLIEKGESIFESVLISMYNKYEERCREIADMKGSRNDYLQRELGIEFTNVMKSFNSRRNHRKSGQNEIQNLHDASQRINLNDEFGRLVNNFLKFLSKGDNAEGFLVISIDDLDMNIDNAFRLMEEIHQFFMAYNIIVFLTLNITQFSHICENHFSKLCPMNSTIIEEGKTSDKNQYWKKYVSQITQNYVDKILPAENRICLPGIHNENRKPLLINFESNIQEHGDLGKQKIKWVILYKIFRRTGIICDGKGKKKHYYEPDTLRKVVSLVDYLNQMDIAFDENFFTDGSMDLMLLKPEKVDTIEKILVNNMNSIFKDIVERMEYEKLQPEQRADFDEIRRQHTSRQCMAAYNYLIREMALKKEKQSSEDRNGMDEKSLSMFQNYSFGNYINVLYKYSFYYEKKMIHMLLALQTTNLTFLYNEIAMKKDQVHQEAMENFRQVMGKSVTGDWAYIMLQNVMKYPDVKSEVRDDFFSSTLYARNNIFHQDRFECNIILPDCTDASEIVSEIVNVVSVLIPNIGKIRIKEKNNKLALESVDNVEQIDIFGFVMRYFDAEKHENRLKKNLEITIDSQSVLEAKWGIREETLVKKEEKYRKCALPVYSLDVYYNLLKRLFENKDSHFEKLDYDDIVYFTRDEIEAILPDTGNIDMVINYADAYLKVLSRVSFLLKEQDEYYNKISISNSSGSDDTEDKGLLHLQHTFLECPFINRLMDPELRSDPVVYEIAKYEFALIGYMLYSYYLRDKKVKDKNLSVIDESNSLPLDVKKIGES